MANGKVLILLSQNGDRSPSPERAAWREVIDFAWERPLACTLQGGSLVSRAATRPAVALAWAALAFLLLGLGSQPLQYVSTAQVLLPAQQGAASRIRTLRHAAADPVSAANATDLELRAAAAGDAQILAGASVVAEAGKRWMLVPGALLLAMLLAGWYAAWKKSRRVPDRAVVRDAIMLAQRGHKTALVHSSAGFRVVLADNAPDRQDLKVLARLSGGALVLARRG